MCITFIYINNNPPRDGFQLIITNNRDELYDRPTKSVQFWDSHPECLGGVDNFPGREGGTWFGVSKHNKVGMLLNILTSTGPLPNKKNRGFLVVDYLTSSLPANEYIAPIITDANLYNAFNLVLLEKVEDEWGLVYYSNYGNSVVHRSYNEGFYGISNSVIDKPFNKVTAGKERFQEIVSQYGSTAQQDILEEQLKSMMWDKTRHFPDLQMEAQGGESLKWDREQRTGIFVDSSHVKYGTRTTSILTVDSLNQAKFLEHTMEEPINAEQPSWKSKCLQFKMLNGGQGSVQSQI